MPAHFQAPLFRRQEALFSATRQVANAFIVPAEPLCSQSRMFYLLHFSAPWFCLAALAANAAAFGRSLRWVFQGFPISKKKGANEGKPCRPRKMLQHEYLVAKIGVDRAENEPSKVSPKGGSKLAVSGVNNMITLLRFQAMTPVTAEDNPVPSQIGKSDFSEIV